MRVPSAVITWMEGEGVIEVKDEESKDIWCEAPESKTHSECEYMRTCEKNNLRKEKRTLLVAVRRETFEIAQLKY